MKGTQIRSMSSLVGSLRSSLFGVFNKGDPQCPHHQAATHDPTSPLPSHQPVFKEEYTDTGVVITKLSNGVTIVTEKPRFPGNVDLAVLLKVGTRDETEASSGSLLSIKNTYYKSSINTNETIN